MPFTRYTGESARDEVKKTGTEVKYTKQGESGRSEKKWRYLKEQNAIIQKKEKWLNRYNKRQSKEVWKKSWHHRACGMTCDILHTKMSFSHPWQNKCYNSVFSSMSFLKWWTFSWIEGKKILINTFFNNWNNHFFFSHNE